ncbi:MAG TPA: class I SAM-dependent methyltransferase [Acidobacteriaceae bacterium]|jgi:ubiquinone/menaquinone biosynthesis C-methylase UbiE|nr:class I SAM-dependent methyltransferase [Acidobacteriaceae bacterium]
MPLYVRAMDLSDMAARRREMIPPRTMNFVGDGDYKAIGLEFRNLFIRYGGLKPDDRVLDVGCGIGRMAGRLTDYLSAHGEYVGFDIVKKGVKWCQSHITPRYPNFHFYHSNVRNTYYNPKGVYEASSYRFPHEDENFDFVFLTSVFTHMFPADLENYLREISRVLRKGGNCFITMFLLNEESQNFIQQGSSSQKFIYKLEGCVTTDPKNPEAALAFEESRVRELFARSGLSIREPIHYGAWCGRKKYLSGQDIVIATKN